MSLDLHMRTVARAINLGAPLGPFVTSLTPEGRSRLADALTSILFEEMSADTDQLLAEFAEWERQHPLEDLLRELEEGGPPP